MHLGERRPGTNDDPFIGSPHHSNRSPICMGASQPASRGCQRRAPFDQKVLTAVVDTTCLHRKFDKGTIDTTKLEPLLVPVRVRVARAASRRPSLHVLASRIRCRSDLCNAVLIPAARYRRVVGPGHHPQIPVSRGSMRSEAQGHDDACAEMHSARKERL